MNNFRDFRVAFLHSKFWTHNSLMVPESKVVLNEDFVDWHNLLRIPSQIQHFKVYWFAKGISGEICIPGQWNYAYIDGKFYHLVKTFSNGFIKGVEEEWFYYNVIYDDWQNDWLNNTFYLKGTIELTGDQELVRKHIHQTSPIIENVNGYRFLNGTQATESNAETVLKLPEKIPLSMQLEGMSSVDRLNINRELEAFHARGKLLPDEDKLCLPFMYKVSTSGNWKWNILRGIDRLIREGMQVFDVTVQSMVDAGQAGKFRNILENMLGSDELYLASNSSNRVYSFAKSVNPTKWLSEIDLSGCIDIIVYDRLRLVPLFNVENPEKKFKVGDFVDGLIRRHGWPSDYRNEMIDIFNDVVAPAFAPLLAHEDDWDTKIFRDVGIEKIERKADYWDYEKKVFTDKPIWVDWADTQLIGMHHHKNFMWDNWGHLIHAFPQYRKEIEEDKVAELSALYRKIIDDIHYSKLPDGFAISDTYSISPKNALVYLPNEYKLKSDTDTTGYLDFSRNSNERNMWVAMIPDYDRKTHTLGVMHQHSKESYAKGSVKPSSKDPMNADRVLDGKPMFYQPIIIDEIEANEESLASIDWKKPSTELLRIYKNIGKGIEHPRNNGVDQTEYRDTYTDWRAKGAEILSRGYTFYRLQMNVNHSSSMYFIRHIQWHSQCTDKKYCVWSLLARYPSDYSTTADISFAQRPECVYTSDKREWRRFHTEMTFPVKTDGFSILDILREYDDIPDNFLRWEVINTNVKKGKIKVYARSYVGVWDSKAKKRDDRNPGAYRLTKEEEAAIPKDSVVSIFICLRQSGSPEGDAEFDKQAADEYKKKYNRYWFDRMNKLIKELYKKFFLTKWETNGEYGAIPDWIKRSTTGLEGELYPANGDGRSQLSLSWMKPHNGRWYVAWTRFFAPQIHGENIAFRILDNSGKLLDLQGTNDWLAAEIPNNYADSGQYYSKNAYRDRVTEVKMNTLLAFYYGGWCPDGSDFVIEREYSRGNEYPKSLSTWPTLNDIGNFTTHLVITNTPKAHEISNYGWKELWRGAEKIYEEWTKYLKDWNNLILDNFIKSSYKYSTKRLDNPRKIPNKWRSTNPRDSKLYQFSPFDNELPSFMFPYFDINNNECALHTWERNDMISTKEDRLQLYREKLTWFNRYTLQMLETWNTWIKFEGTNWYASIKINNKDSIPKWDYELFTNEITSFKNVEEKKWNFINHKENDVDVLINTRSELNILGNTFKLKSKFTSNEDILDIGLHVKPLEDVKQSEAAAWFAVQMNLNEQDVFQTFIETPKELTKYQGFSAYERERLIREIGLKSDEFLYNKQRLEYQREENKFTNQYEKDWIYKEWKYEVARGATQIVGGVLDIASGGAGVVASVANMVGQTAVNQVFSSGYEGMPEFPPRYLRGDNFITDMRFNAPVPYRGHYKQVPGKTRYFNYDNPHARDNLAYLSLGARHGARAGGGLMGIVGGGLTIAEAYETFDIKDTYRRNKYALAEKKLATEGDILNKRHEYERKNLLDDLWAMSANVVYPQLNANLVFRLYNKHMGLKDIHMVQYYPKGRLLDYIKQYYREYGYNLMVRDFECVGIMNVVKHLRYQHIYEISYPNIGIQEMIRARALAGIKVIPWVQ